MKTTIRLWMAGLAMCLASASSMAQTPFKVIVQEKYTYTDPYDGKTYDVENKYVQTVTSVMSYPNDTITYFADGMQLLPHAIAADPTCRVFSDALKATGLAGKLEECIDLTYSVGIDSVGWKSDKLIYAIAVRNDGSVGEYDNTSYPEVRYKKFTAFVPQDEVLAKYGVTDVASLAKLAATIYDKQYPTDKDVADYTDPRNSLNRFMSYHLLPFLGKYYKLTCVDGDEQVQNAQPSLVQSFARRYADIADWYETMMAGASMKFSFPSGSESGLYINRRGVQAEADCYGVKIRGVKVTQAMDDDDNMVANGIYHYIDDILCYGTYPASDVAGNAGVNVPRDVLATERWRVDASTLSPDFMTSGARGLFPRANGVGAGGRYANASFSANALNNHATCYAFKSGSLEHFQFEDKNTHVHLRPRYQWFWSYGGDELILKGRFNLTVDLPPLPNGDYELRLGTVVNFASRGVMNFYIDDQLVAENIDMRKSASELFGFKSDSSLGDEETIRAFDKEIREKGWMKGPANFNSIGLSWNSVDNSFRNFGDIVRFIIGKVHSENGERHTLRIEQVAESNECELNFDYLELCPTSICDNPDVVEDIW